MLDPKMLRENPQALRTMLKNRNFKFPLDDLIDLDNKRRELIVQVEELRRKKNLSALAISHKVKNHVDPVIERKEMRTIGDELLAIEAELRDAEAKFKRSMMTLPNIIDKSVPIGKDETDNTVLRYSGTIRDVDFGLKDHVDIANSLGLLDLERAAKIAGARFYFLKNELVKLNLALIHYALDFLAERGYVLTQPPFLIRKEAMDGAVIFADLNDMIYKIENEDMYLIGTSEHSIAAMHMNEIIGGKDLPLKYASISPCFRKEAGAHGKDTKGIFRVHQFEKVEQFVYSRPEQSEQLHQQILKISEEFYERLGIPYRTILLCSADLGKTSSKTFDLEAWMPIQRNYREIVSCSNCADFQARRLNIRFRDRTNEKTRFVHTLNSTLVATERTIACIMENYQTSSGTIEVPVVLRNYMSGIKEIGKE
jgi:seryl-tRNA synthetase